jgi:hypothetical protein
MPINPLLAGSLTTVMLVNTVDPVAAASLTDVQWRTNFPAAVSSDAPVRPNKFETSVSREPEWIARLTNNARRVAALKAGWDGQGSISVSRKALFLGTSHTRFALENLDDVSAPHLVPGGDGSIQIEWHARHGELELDIDARGGMSIWIRDHRSGAEFDGENEAALALFYRWAPWVASQQHHGPDAVRQAQVPLFSIAA